MKTILITIATLCFLNTSAYAQCPGCKTELYQYVRLCNSQSPEFSYHVSNIKNKITSDSYTAAGIYFGFGSHDCFLFLNDDGGFTAYDDFNGQERIITDMVEITTLNYIMSADLQEMANGWCVFYIICMLFTFFVAFGIFFFPCIILFAIQCM